MANQEHLDILKQGVETWNQWRIEHTLIQPDLRKANLEGADLFGANLEGADLFGANLEGADLERADLTKAILIQADLRGAILIQATLTQAILTQATLTQAILIQADLRGASLSRTDLRGAKLIQADLSDATLIQADLSGVKLNYADLNWADLRRANLNGADLEGAILVGTNFTDAILTSCHIYGIAAWNVELRGATQNNLVITPGDEPTITVDNLKIAQFIYLLLNNQEIRDTIDTIAKKAVLILGRFTPERKAILDALKEALRTHKYVPILFDFEKPSSRDLTETVSTLAHLSRFIIVDLSVPRSIPQELQAIVPHLAVPVQPLLYGSKRVYGMFQDFKKYPWVLPVYRYKDLDSLLTSLKEHVIDPAEQKAKELEKR